MMRRLVDDDCPGLVFKLFNDTRAFLFIPRQKCLKRKPPCRPARHGKCCNARCCPGKRGNRHALLVADAHNVLTRVRNAGCSCISDEGYIFALLKLCHKLVGFIYLVKLMIARHGCLYLKMIEQLYGVSRILRCDEVYLLKCAQHTECDVLQISYRSCAQIQCSCHMILLLFSVIPGLIAVYLIYLIRVYIRLLVYN